jgi:hypothetical protein
VPHRRGRTAKRLQVDLALVGVARAALLSRVAAARGELQPLDGLA